MPTPSPGAKKSAKSKTKPTPQVASVEHCPQQNMDSEMTCNHYSIEKDIAKEKFVIRKLNCCLKEEYL